MKRILLSSILTAGVSMSAMAYDASQTFKIQSEQGDAVMTLSEMMGTLKVQAFTVYDEAYHQDKTYEGISLKALLEHNNYSLDSITEITVVCADGYKAVLDGDILRKYPDAMISYRQLDQNGKGIEGDFEPIREGKKIADPSPFYMVWPQKETYGIFPWPHQVVALQVSANDSYEMLKPSSSASISVHDGYKLFKGACLACHSINLVGGVIGPELNIPQNITEYRSKEYMRQFIRNPDSFRARSRMTGLPDLSDQDIDNAIAYLEYMKNHKDIGKLSTAER
ncbi:c-type cytochrome [Oceanospirillum beijerinckii]|uniref:c-type cytochrome n=1 Tax=Oceanospirillum beijerinckii TaxID=64976 RepID=UPI0003F8F0CF|nr:c-type cytochrome [Oceanospirillum beijerinckii]